MAMVRELGAISDLQAAEALLENRDCALGFDATTQEGQYIGRCFVHTGPGRDAGVGPIRQIPNKTLDSFS